MKTLLPLLASALLSTACANGESVKADYAVIPLPQEIQLNETESPFVLDGKVTVVYPAGNPQMERNARFLSEYIATSIGHAPAVKELEEEKKMKNVVFLDLNPEIKHPEGYRLHVASDAVRIEGQTEAGVFRGIQTLRKSIPATVGKGTAVLLPAGEVTDEPRFSYRGMHLDVSRHFFPVEFVKKYIDILALHNMNTFHWHLTDDQGWRIEIKRYPRLTEVGSMRNRTVKGRIGSGEYDLTPYGGYYTQEQIKEVVAYAAERHINIIPEIDLPGHMLAALAAYPELGCTGGPYEVCPDWGVFEDVLCLGNDSTFSFLEGVLSEVIELFPSKYIHIGGDEVPRTRWQHCPKCQARIRAEGLKADGKHSAEDRLQTYCMKRMEDFLESHGRHIIGWDEILEGDVAPAATVMSWRGSAGGIQAARMGHDVVMTPNTHCYFDYYQTEDTADEPLAIGGFISVEKVYNLDPVAGLTPEQAAHVLGVQANLWTEYITTTDYVEYMVLPRMAALAEVQWTSPDCKDFTSFLVRLPRLADLYQREGWNYATHLFK